MRNITRTIRSGRAYFHLKNELQFHIVCVSVCGGTLRLNSGLQFGCVLFINTEFYFVFFVPFNEKYFPEQTCGPHMSVK